MREEVYNFIERNEESHWWYRGRRLIFEEILGKILKGKSDGKIYEVGCAGGGNFEVWQKFSDFCVGVDISQRALDFCRKYGYKELILADAENLSGIPDEGAFMVTACDVLEHISDDKKALKEFYRILEKEGILFLTAPAFQFLWGGADKLSLHKRRYNKEQLENLLKSAGFKVLRSTYFNTLLFPPVLIGRILERILKLKPEVEYKSLPGFLNHLFFKIFAFERYLLKYFNLPFGVSLMAIAKK